MMRARPRQPRPFFAAAVPFAPVGKRPPPPGSMRKRTVTCRAAALFYLIACTTGWLLIAAAILSIPAAIRLVTGR